MHVVLGAAGNVGSKVVAALRRRNAPVLAVFHSAKKAEALAEPGVETAVADVQDVEALRAVLKRGRRAFLLNPPAHPSSDTSALELRTARAIADAVSESDLEKVVVASTYGARDEDGVGDLSSLYAFERWVGETGVPTAINRAAYYFTNLDRLAPAAEQGSLPTLFPADFALPMVSATDLGEAGAARLLSDTGDVGIAYVEGPERYSFSDVGRAFSAKLGRRVEVATIPREGWEDYFLKAGFSKAAAASYARMTAATIDDEVSPGDPRRGVVSLEAHIQALGST